MSTLNITMYRHTHNTHTVYMKVGVTADAKCCADPQLLVDLIHKHWLAIIMQSA